MSGPRYAVVGGGIVGDALSRRLADLRPGARVTSLEKESDLAVHQAILRRRGVLEDAAVRPPARSAHRPLCCTSSPTTCTP